MTLYQNTDKNEEIWTEQDMLEYYTNMQSNGLYLDLTFSEFVNEMLATKEFTIKTNK